MVRYQGKIVEWDDARGFGFAIPNGGGVRVFLHVSAVQAGQRRPRLLDPVRYEILTDARGRPRAVNVTLTDSHGLTVAAAPRRDSRNGDRPIRSVRRRGRSSGGWRVTLLALVVVAAIAQWRSFDRSPPGFERDVAMPSGQPAVEAPRALFHCEGKTRCPQMRSCEEAQFYLQHCPNVEIDGDHDGIPCEDQWCRY